MHMETVSIAIVLAVFAILVVVKTAVVVPQQNAFVVERLGKFQAVLDAGFHVLLPFIDVIRYRHTLKEQAVEIPEQICITKDNVQVAVDGILYLKVLDPQRASYGISDYYYAISQLAQTALRSEIGKIDLDRTFEERTHINGMVIAELDKATGPWGIKVLRYEIKNITPPKDVLAAMEKQMRAEREKRAVVLTSEGERDAAINSAEGKKQQVIKESEAARQRQINEAEGQAQAILAVAAATGEGLRRGAAARRRAVRPRVRPAREDQQHGDPAREPLRHRLDDRARNERAARRKGSGAGPEHRRFAAGAPRRPPGAPSGAAARAVARELARRREPLELGAVPPRIVLAADPREDARRVEVRVGEGGGVGEERLVEEPLVLERDAEVEGRDGPVAGRPRGEPVVDLGAAPVAALVQQASEVQVRAGVGGVDLERSPVGVLRLARSCVVEVAAPPVPRVRVERCAAARVDRGPDDRRDALREIADVEVEQDLTRLRVPARTAVLHDDLGAVRRDPHRRERPPFRELPPKRSERAPDACLRDVCVDEPGGGAEQHEILEREAELVPGPSARRHEPRAREAAHLREREVEHPRDV